MSAEDPTPSAASPRPRSRLVKSNRRQALLFAALTLILTVATVWGGRTWLRHSETLSFAVGDAGSLEARFAARLAAVLRNNNSKLRLTIVPNADSAKALALFDRRQADLAVLRTDAKIPSRARALAVLEHDLVLLISPGNKPIKSLAELKKRKIAVVADGEGSAAFVRTVLEIPDGAEATSRVQLAPANSTFDGLLAPGGFGAVVVDRARLEGHQGQELRTIRQTRRIYRECDRGGENARQKKSRHFRGNPGQGHAGLVARDSG